MPIDLLANRLVWCGDASTPVESQDETPPADRHDAYAMSLDFSPFGTAPDASGRAAVADQVLVLIRRMRALIRRCVATAAG